MMEHETWNLISAHIDGELTAIERSQVEAHLQSCDSCRREAEELRQAKRWTTAAPRRTAPPQLIADLEERLANPSWRERLYDWRHTCRHMGGWYLRRGSTSFSAGMPQVRWPAGAVAFAALALALWVSLRHKAAPEYLPLEPLLAAHSRYSAESLAPAGDLVASNFSAQLAMSSTDEE